MGTREMLKIDVDIINVDRVICSNIASLSNNRGLLSQNILSQLRNLVEYMIMKIVANGKDVDSNNYDLRTQYLAEFKKRKGKLAFIQKFHDLLQISASHYTFDENNSERLMLKYYEFLVLLKKYMQSTHKMLILKNLSDFPIDNDESMLLYYKEILKVLQKTVLTSKATNDRFYVHKCKPVIVNEEVFYELTFSDAVDNASKFDRIIAFSKEKILTNYALKFALHEEPICVLGSHINIKIIDAWEVSIRPCELNNYASILGFNREYKANDPEYRQIMNFLKAYLIPLNEYIESDDVFYNRIKKEIVSRCQSDFIFQVLDKSRQIIKNDLPGCNVLRYLLFLMNNRVIKKQRHYEQKSAKLSNLNLSWGCIPFDEMPFATALVNHNPRLADLLECIPIENREHEFFARKIMVNTENKEILFTSKKDLSQFQNIEDLVNTYNRKLYVKHGGRKIINFHDNFYIKSYAENCRNIIQILNEKADYYIRHYEQSVDHWLNDPLHYIDCIEKKKILRKLFSETTVAVIYGAAGTGKSTLISHISKFFDTKNKLYLTSTHSALENLQRKVNSGNCTFLTIEKFIKNPRAKTDYDLLVIDECSTISNEDMYSVLNKANFTFLVLVGDIHQIESIRFGNWFNIARAFLPKESIFELTNIYRSSEESLQLLWDRVRQKDDAIKESLVKNRCSEPLNASIFNRLSEDEIILCLNYDGLYGINNVNSYLQGHNPNRGVVIGVNTFKIGDPILFNEKTRFAPLIYNNLKGRIIDIKEEKDSVLFSIEIERVINSFDASGYGFELLEPLRDDCSLIRFSVSKYRSTDDDQDDPYEAPFQIAYAVSIHKAQGLEFDSVKIVISNEVEDQISHNIFYTAITRAKKILKIYWSPEVEEKVLQNLEIRNVGKDVNLLRALYGI